MLADMRATRDYLQDAAKVLGRLQLAFMEPQPHDWQYGLQVFEDGFMTQPLVIGDEPQQAVLDLQLGQLQVGGTAWELAKYSPSQLLDELRKWLSTQATPQKLPDLSNPVAGATFNLDTARALGTAFWSLEQYFETLRTQLSDGVLSPVLVYPHHFDLSLTWFPGDDDKQLSVGFSTGDETITEPYLYLTAYPEPAGFTALELPSGAYWQTTGFSGAILPYAVLQGSSHPEQLLQTYVADTLYAARKLFPQI